ncbi:MAG: purine-binding chemotaxis protein CheW [Deltaproteobacteria bacterium]|nr:purine-binding chemotaxis protein CheW [Deltaproteobacteria bacterium]MBW1993745.1 purine-binding chemotaxis protein CheW [Deltaproteobacteria bacterium]MBW2152921.1 purine-binding chemotaxis protein CheW [Deltaproteobacteria bacterium]
MSKSDHKRNNKAVELATFYAGEALCGMDILNIQEINKLLDMTPVPHAPEYVKGILNLRGQIVTIIDLRRKLGLPPVDSNKDENRNIIVNSENEYIGLFVERISDVVRANWDEVQPPPVNIGGVQGKYFEGVLKTDTGLIGILNANEVLKQAD